MEITGKVHCFFEQSGTFKNEFIKLGIPAEDYDIQNNFGQTDHQIDLFAEIENAYNGKPSIFDNVGGGDLIMAFFPCIYFCDNSQILHTWGAHPKADCRTATERILSRSRNRQLYYERIIKLLTTAKERGIRLIVENPLGMHSYLRSCFVTQPALVDKYRNRRGDEFAKPTGYWYINCEPTLGESWQPKSAKRVKKDAKRSSQVGVCSEERSMISPDYARNFICDFIIGKVQNHTQQTLF